MRRMNHQAGPEGDAANSTADSAVADGAVADSAVADSAVADSAASDSAADSAVADSAADSTAADSTAAAGTRAGPESVRPESAAGDREPIRPDTGEPGVDAALTLLDRLAELPVTEHAAVFEQVHAELTAVLGQLDPESAGADG